jgi:hypothetical protein
MSPAVHRGASAVDQQGLPGRWGASREGQGSAGPSQPAPRLDHRLGPSSRTSSPRPDSESADGARPSPSHLRTACPALRRASRVGCTWSEAFARPGERPVSGGGPSAALPGPSPASQCPIQRQAAGPGSRAGPWRRRKLARSPTGVLAVRSTGSCPTVLLSTGQ